MSRTNVKGASAPSTTVTTVAKKMVTDEEECQRKGRVEKEEEKKNKSTRFDSPGKLVCGGRTSNMRKDFLRGG